MSPVDVATLSIDDAFAALAKLPRAAPPLEAHVETLVSLKRRWRTLRRVLAGPERDALELAPALLACSFDAPGLKSDTPGVEGFRPAGRYQALARRLGLPNLISPQTGRRLAAAILVLHEDGQVRVLVEPAEAISTSFVARIAERCAAATELFAKLKLPLRFELLRPGVLDPPALARLLALGALRAGRPGKWLTEAMRAVPVTPQLRRAWVPHAPTPYCRVRLMLGVEPQLEAPRLDPFAEMRVLRVELLRALKKTPLFDRPTFRAHLKRELLPGRVPASLLPALREATAKITRKNAPQLKASISSGGVELSLNELPFASARTLLQARVRALLLAHALWGFVPDVWLTGPQWKKLAQRLGTEKVRTTLLFALASEGTALCLTLKAGREPRMRELDATQTLKRIISAAAEGHLVELVPCSQLQELEAMRLSQIAWRAAANSGEPLSIAVGARTLRYADGSFKSYSTRLFHARPRRVVPLDVAPLNKNAQALGSVVECDAHLDGDGAVMAYRSKGWAFRERVSLDALSSHLNSTSAICAAHFEHPKFVLTLDDGLTKRLKSGRVQSAPACALEVRGDLTRGLKISCQGQTFASRELKAAAETILSAWQVGIRGALDVRFCAVGVSGAHGEAIACLYARSLVIRRLNEHIDVMVGLKVRRRYDFIVQG
ncbi:MAG: hypothetical protein IPJ65_10310 [Archangiaceae bacterium]|nr:hypothetical protein [Archangiaceae bacterium]